MLKKLYRAFQNFIKYLRKGGVVYVNVSQVTYTECLKGRKALITGGGSGVGYAIAQKFLSSGAEVTITGRNPDKLAQVAAHLNSTRLHTLVWDAANISSTEKKINEAIQIMEGLDILVNNAGLYTFLPFEKIDEAEWDKIIHTNLKGTFFICQQAVKDFKKEKEKTRVKKIINISSTRGFQGDCGPYGISKWGVNALTKGLARDYTHEGILVNGIAPGIIATPLNGIDPRGNVFDGSNKEHRTAIAEEIAELALFLANDSSNHITGQIIACDGGETLL